MPDTTHSTDPMSNTWYKLASPDGFDFYTGRTINYRAALGTVVTCADYAPTQDCGAGIHLSRNPNDCFVGATVPCSAYRVEPTAGLVTIDAHKSKAQAVRIVEEITDLGTLLGWDYHGLLAHLAAIAQTRWFQPDGQPDPAWHLTIGDTWAAARAAAWAAAWDAAWGAAWGAARAAARAAAWDAARAAAWDAAWGAARAAAWDAAWGAAWGAARAAARAAAWDAAWGAARAAAWDAARAAICYVCEGLPLEVEHSTHLRAFWDVWRKGYALLCEVNGRLYVYAAPPTTT